MDKDEQDNLFTTLNSVLMSIIDDKRKNPKNSKALSKFKARINLGYQMEEDNYFWANLVAENGNYKLSRGKLDDYDIVLKLTPEDAMGFHSGELSTIQMVTKKNEFGYKKLRFEKGSTGKRNLGILLKFPKVFVLDKIKK